MCGIIGIASVAQIQNQNWLSKGADKISHRGPNDYSEWWSSDRKVGLAHRRLSIIDLSELANQPMTYDNDQLVIVFNGEIYNFLDLKNQLFSFGYSFKTNSDTEVILAGYQCWGTEIVSKLNGMFAFAIYDIKKSIIFFARDRVGEKPMYFYELNGVIRFASELKGLLVDDSLPRVVDMESLDCYLSMGFIPRNRCILKGYNKLPAGHAMEFSVITGKAKCWKYWDLPPEFDNKRYIRKSINDELLVIELENLLRDSVRRQLISDVPIGVLLSGGVDSSIVTAMASEALPKLKTFTVSMKGYGKLDESSHASLIANHFNTEHIELVADATSVDLIWKLVEQFDEPIIDSSMFPTYLVTNLVSQYCTVALGGDGADELFGGYNHYSKLLKLLYCIDWIPLALRKKVFPIIKNIIPRYYRSSNLEESFYCDFETEIPQIAKYFDKKRRARLLDGFLMYNSIADELFESLMEPASSVLQRATRTDFGLYLCEDILVKVDRASMLNSLEVRAPFLDYRIIEFAFSKVPDEYRASQSDRKILLKKLAKKCLPIDFDLKRKQGFSIPLSEWLKKGEFRDLFWSILTDSSCIFNKKEVIRLFKEHDQGINNGERLFALVQFQIWANIYKVSF